MTSVASGAAVIPNHVPSELVVESPLYACRTIYENPFETIIPRIHEGPRMTYVTNIAFGHGAGWLARRAQDLRTLLQDSENFEKRGMTKFAAGIGENWILIPTEADPPSHGIYRKALNPHFSPQKMMAKSDDIRRRARALIGNFKDRGECDFLEEFSVLYPVNIFLDMLGLPRERLDAFREWERNLLHTNDPERRAAATRAAKNYLSDEVNSRRKVSKDDYISLALTFDYENRKWSHDEIVGHCFNLFLGGLDTVTSHLGWSFYHLATHPGHQRQLREQPAMIVHAVEELLRAYAPVTSFRICRKEMEFGEVLIKPGDYVSVATPVVGRDPEHYHDANEVCFSRKPTMFGLGGGIHKCLGMHLARRELQIAIEEFLAAIPDFRVKDGGNIPFYVGNNMAVQSLPLVWNK